jgi:acyl-CoA reductase-like NAD-dependent aldehyde dehydrogenase
LFVQREQLGSLLNALKQALATRPMAVTLNPDHASRLRDTVSEAQSQGAAIETGGFDEAGRFLPTILTTTTQDCPTMQRDLFAPVVTVLAVDLIDEALAADRMCPYALGSSIFGDRREATKLAGHIDAGCITINDLIVPTADPRLPFAPRHQSGHGVTRGNEGLLAMTRLKAITTQRLTRLPHLDDPQPSDVAFFTQAIQLLHGKGVKKKFRSVCELIKLGRARKRKPTASDDMTSPANRPVPPTDQQAPRETQT